MVHAESGSGQGRSPRVPNTDLRGSLELIGRYETSIHANRRRSHGVHYTPYPLARMLASRALDVVVERLGRLPTTVMDPSCGSGTFLLAVGEELVERGLDPTEVVRDRLFGQDIDPRALEVAQDALGSWAAADRTHDGGHPSAAGTTTANLSLGDVLDVAGGAALGEHDLVIGNPPFLTQLRSTTAVGQDRLRALSEELGPLHPYVDVSAVFLLISMRATTEGGVVCLLQPQSFLSNDGAGPVRDAVVASNGLVEVWSSSRMFFDASVRVCALTIGPDGPYPERGDTATTDVVIRWSEDPATPGPTLTYSEPRPRPGDTWGYMIARALGVPRVHTTDAGPRLVVGDVCRVTAGFRDEYYALRDACREHDVRDDGVAPHEDLDRADEVGGAGSDGVDRSGVARLVTSGMIRPLGCRWGERRTRIGGRNWERPVVDTARPGLSEGRIGRWVRERLVPKVLVATQSRIVEACADPHGRMVPMTPVMSVEPVAGWERMVDPDGTHEVDLWWLVAALSAPSVSVVALTANLGSGLSSQSMRWSAKSVCTVGLPTELDHWASGARTARELDSAPEERREELLATLGRQMLAAHGLGDDRETFQWWFDRAVRA